MTSELAPSDRTLYVIVDDLSAYTETQIMLEAQLADAPDEDRDELRRQIAEVKEALERIGQELANKTDAVAAVLRRLKIEREAIHQERQRLKTKEEASDRGERWLRGYVVEVMRQNGMTRMRTPTNSLYLRDTEAVEILDGTALDPEYLMAELRLPLSLWRAIMQTLQASAKPRVAEEAGLVRVKAEPSLSTIKKAIKSGVNVEGADLRLNTHLVAR